MRSRRSAISLLVAIALTHAAGIASAASVRWVPVSTDSGFASVVTPEGLLLGGDVLGLLDSSGAVSIHADTSTQVPGSAATFTSFGPEEYHDGRSVFMGFDSEGRRGIYTLFEGNISRIALEGDPVPGGGGATFVGLREPRIGGAGVVFLGIPSPLGSAEELYYSDFSGGSLELVTDADVPDITPFDQWHAVGEDRVFFSAGTSVAPSGLWSWQPGVGARQEVRNNLFVGDDLFLTRISQAVVHDVIGDTVYFSAVDGFTFQLRTATYDGVSVMPLTVDGIPVGGITAMDDAGNMLFSSLEGFYAFVGGELTQIHLDDETFGAPFERLGFHQGSMFGNRILAWVWFEDAERGFEAWMGIVPGPQAGASLLAALASLVGLRGFGSARKALRNRTTAAMRNPGRI